MTDNHGSTAFIIRKLPARADQPAFKLIQMSISALLKGKFDEVAYLEPGDIVNIPPADVYFVAGDLKSASAFPFTEGVTVLQAIARARGVASGAKPGKAIIFRQDPNTGQRQEITVDLDALTRGEQKDIPLQPNDIVILPTAQNRIGPWPRLLDAPPIRVFAPCRGSRPCMARLDLCVMRETWGRAKPSGIDPFGTPKPDTLLGYKPKMISAKRKTKSVRLSVFES